MVNRRKKIAFLPMLALMICMICQIFPKAATVEKDTVTVQLTGYDGDAGELRIGAGETLYDSGGDALLKEGDEVSAVFSKEGDICTAKADLYKGIKYYISDGIDKVSFVPEKMVCKVSFNNSTKDKAVTDTSSGSTKSGNSDSLKTSEEVSQESETETVQVSDTVLGVKTKTPRAVADGEELKCVVSSLSGSSDTDADTFLLQCEVPKGTVLESVYTGTYNEEVTLELVCKTEKDGQWHTWGENISSLKGETFKTDGITFSEGDRICSFAISAANAPKGFSLKEEDPCYYYVRIVDKDSVADFNGTTKVTAYLDGKKVSNESKFTTLIQDGVQTGDDNVILIGSFILLIISVVTLISYIICRVVFYQKDKAASHQKLPVTYRKGEVQGTQGKMSDLLGKKPG